MLSDLTPEETTVLEALAAAYPEKLQLRQVGTRTTLSTDRLLRAVDNLFTRCFVEGVPLRDQNGLNDAANILITTAGMKFVDGGESERGKRLISSASPAESNSRSTSLPTATVLRILIASPSDVIPERDVVTKAIHEWNAVHSERSKIILQPVRWETHSFPASGDRPQAIINKQIGDSGQILIGIFGYRLGTPTGEAQSGTIEEIESFRQTGKYIALYFSSADVPREADRDQLAALESYQRERQKDTLYSTFSTPAELHSLVTKHIPNIVSEVHEKLRSSSNAATTKFERSNTSDSDLQPSPTAAKNGLLLADLISELEDNLEHARAPRIGEAYARPESEVWKKNRNKLTFPVSLHSEVTQIYREIESWSTVVKSGVSPNMGSPAIENTTLSLMNRLPILIDQLKRLR